jgi:serine phosphatase RsbU (regulator of sigma subunit)
MAPEEVDKKVRERISEFGGETEQFDDITTLCFRYN